MTTYLTTLSNHLYEESRERLNQSALKFGIEKTFPYDFDEIKQTNFFAENHEILSNVKYLGFWLWKPYIILEVLEKMSEGDVLVYADAGTEIICKIDWLIDRCCNFDSVMLFGNGSDNNAAWTKRDCFVLMDCDSSDYWFGPHCDASFMLFRKCDYSIDFVKRWLLYSSNPNIITNYPNVSGKENIIGFKDHRYDQSILSLLAQKFRISLYRSPSQFGNHYKMYDYRVQNEFNCFSQWEQAQVKFYNTIPYYNSFYGQLLNHHRTRKVSIEFEQPNEIVSKGNKISQLIKRILTRIHLK